MQNDKGFTLIELLIAIFISAIVAAGVFMVYSSQQKSFAVEEQVTTMQLNLRVAMLIMVRDLREAGLDADQNDGLNFGFTDMGEDASGNSFVEFTIDQDEDGFIDGGDERIYYGIYNDPNIPSASTDLGRAIDADSNGSITAGEIELLALNIEALGLAYAFDTDADGALEITDHATGNRNVYWAIDSDGDGDLDLNLDTNDDGFIDENDDNNGDGVIDSNDNGTSLDDLIGEEPDWDEIRNVRIWLLARAEREDITYTHPQDGAGNLVPYVVGNRLIMPLDGDGNPDGYRRRLLTTVVNCVNMGY